MTTDPALLAPPATSPVAPGERPVFGVVVAAYQAAGTIARAVESVLGQTQPPAELVVADDGSTDDLAGALAPFGDAVRLVRIPHGGESAAKNAGVAATTTPWAVFLDADDAWDPRRLERLGDLGAARPDLDLLNTDAWFTVEGERRGRFHGDKHPFPTADQRRELLRRDWVFAGAAVRRTAWDRIGGFTLDVAYAADWHCWLRMVLTGSVAGCVAEPLVDYAIHDASLSADRSASLLARVDVLDRVVAELALTGPEAEVARQMRASSLQRGLFARAEAALLEGRADARRSCVAYARAPGLAPATRLTALAAAVVPGVAAARLRRQAAAAGRTRSARASAA